MDGEEEGKIMASPAKSEIMKGFDMKLFFIHKFM